MNIFTTIFFQIGIVLVVLVLCYIIIKMTVKKELQKGLPMQIRSAQDLFRGKPVRLIVKISPHGQVDFEHFEIINEPAYVG